MQERSGTSERGDGGTLRFYSCHDQTGHPGRYQTGTCGEIYHVFSRAPDRDCPCRSGSSFEFCCLPARFQRLFVKDPDGLFSPVQINNETIANVPFENIKSGLNQGACFFNTEDTSDSGFWHYRPRTDLDEELPELFGTVELSRTQNGMAELYISTLSNVRYQTVRRQIEAQTDATLPAGEHTSSLLTLNEDQADGTLNIGGEKGVMAQYREVRETMRPIMNNILDEEATEDDLLYVADRLNLLTSDGELLLEDPNQKNLLQDLCVYDVRRQGKPMHYLWWNRNRPDSNRESIIFNAMKNAWVSIVELQEIRSDHAVAVVRGPEEKGRRIHLVDRGMIETVPTGVYLISRFLPLPDYHILSGGWGYVEDETERDTIVDEYGRLIEGTHWREKTYESIRFGREKGLQPIVLSG